MRPILKNLLLVILGICLLVSACQINPVEQALTSLLADTPIVETFSQPVQTLPIPVPQPQFDQAEQAFAAGEYDLAIQEYQNVYDSSTDTEIKASALLGIGRAQFASRNYTAAIDTFNRILGQFSHSMSLAPAYYYLAQSHSIQANYSYAVDAYRQYLALKPGLLDAHVYELQGDAAFSAGDYNTAISAYQEALQSTPPGDANSLNLKIGKSFSALQDYTTAIQIFRTLYDANEDVFIKASADLLMGQAYLQLGMENEAQAAWLDAVIQFPRAYDSYTALTLLIQRGVAVDDMLRGIVDYYAGEYQAAINAFENYILNNVITDGTIYYYKGLSHYFLNQPGYAIQAYDQLIQYFPSNRFWAAAWDEKAYVQWVLLEQYSNAANTLLAFINQVPDAPEAPGFLYEAARILERNNDLEGAANLWLQMMDDYPAYERSYRALFLAGISRYRQAKYEEALTIFRRNVVLATTSEDKAAAYLWLGKTYQAMQDVQNANSFYQQAENTDPSSFYGIRAGELINNQLPLAISGSYDFGYDLNYERSEADSWVRSTFHIDPGVDLNGLGELSGDVRITRGYEFIQLGQYNLALLEFESLQSEYVSSPLNTYRLMNFFYSLGLYRPAILACRNLLDMAGLDDLSSLSVPIYFTHIRFGAYFRPQVVAAANQEGIHPLLLYALLRQESLFDPFIVSSAGARGMAQFMPATGQETATLLGWPSAYSEADLNRPNVAIKFAASYLSRMQRYLNNDLLAALAAYNGGPGNAASWKALAQNDPDLLVEVIRAEETQTYLKQVMEFLNIYKLVYSHPE